MSTPDKYKTTRSIRKILKHLGQTTLTAHQPNSSTQQPNSLRTQPNSSTAQQLNSPVALRKLMQDWPCFYCQSVADALQIWNESVQAEEMWFLPCPFWKPPEVESDRFNGHQQRIAIFEGEILSDGVRLCGVLYSANEHGTQTGSPKRSFLYKGVFFGFHANLEYHPQKYNPKLPHFWKPGKKTQVGESGL